MLGVCRTVCAKEWLAVPSSERKAANVAVRAGCNEASRPA